MSVSKSSSIHNFSTTFSKTVFVHHLQKDKFMSIIQKIWKKSYVIEVENEKWIPASGLQIQTS